MESYFRIVVRGHLDERWSEWFGAMTITHDETGDTVLAGRLPDQAALYGVLLLARDLGLTLVKVEQLG